MLPTIKEVSGEYNELCHSGTNLPSPDFPERFGVVDISGEKEKFMKFIVGITQEMVEKSYEVAKQVHSQKFDKTKGINILNEQYGMNRNSAYKYINGIIGMLNGQRYKWQMRENHTEYFLMMIEKEFGFECLKRALLAVKEHINYDHIKKKPCNVEELYNSFMQKPICDFLAGKNNDEPPTSKELSEEEDKATARSLNDEQRKDRLSKKENKLPETEVKPVKIYKRDADVIAEALKNANGICAKCNKEAPFKREDGALKGQPYLEVHHKIWLSEDGEDTRLLRKIILRPSLSYTERRSY